jgi:hypothetical protein
MMIEQKLANVRKALAALACCACAFANFLDRNAAFVNGAYYFCVGNAPTEANKHGNHLPKEIVY